MKNLIKPLVATLSLACVAQMAATTASAQLVTIGYWRGGENDSPSPVFDVDPGVLGFANNSTVDYTGTYSLSKYGTGGPNTGTAFYASSAAYAGGLPSGSSVALITGGDAGYFTGSINAGMVDFGFQTYVRPNNTVGTQVIASNGGVDSGWNLFTIEGSLLGLAPGYRYFVEVVDRGILDSGVTVDAGGSFHNIAYVNDSGTHRFYYDFSETASAPFGSIVPAAPNFGLGFRASDASRYYTGGIDEARIFTFAPGGFSASELTNYVVPEPSSLALVCVGLGALAVYRFRRRRRC